MQVSVASVQLQFVPLIAVLNLPNDCELLRFTTELGPLNQGWTGILADVLGVLQHPFRHEADQALEKVANQLA